MPSTAHLEWITILVLIGALLVIAGFAKRLNPLVIVTMAGIVTTLLGGPSPVRILNAFGSGFASSRSATIFVIVLPVIGMVKQFGLQQQAKRLISRPTAGRVLVGYLFIHQITAALGLNSIGGQTQTVIIDPTGTVLARAGDGPEVIQAELDLGSLRRLRRDIPLLREVRPELVATCVVPAGGGRT